MRRARQLQHASLASGIPATTRKAEFSPPASLAPLHVRLTTPLPYQSHAQPLPQRAWPPDVRSYCLLLLLLLLLRSCSCMTRIYTDRHRSWRPLHLLPQPCSSFLLPPHQNHCGLDMVRHSLVYFPLSQTRSKTVSMLHDWTLALCCQRHSPPVSRHVPPFSLGCKSL
jgi:hypothetical protein